MEGLNYGKILKDFIYFTDNENIEKLNNEMCKNFYLKKEEIKDKNIKKVQFDNLTFGIYFSKADDNKGRILVLKIKENKMRAFFYKWSKKEFYTDLYFLILHNNEKEKILFLKNLLRKFWELLK